MFTGIIQAVGRIRRSVRQGDDLVLDVGSAGLDMSDVQLGDSIAVNGVCLTVTQWDADSFQADVSAETLRHSRLGDVATGDRVNLEKALQLGGRLGGHLVSGHVDGVGTLVERREDGRAIRLRIMPPEGLARYIATRGSITVDGVSLTVNTVGAKDFWLNVVPHTARETIIGDYRVGQRVHLEADMIARYTERLLQSSHDADESSSGMTLAWLVQQGYRR